MAAFSLPWAHGREPRAQAAGSQQHDPASPLLSPSQRPGRCSGQTFPGTRVCPQKKRAPWNQPRTEMQLCLQSGREARDAGEAAKVRPARGAGYRPEAKTRFPGVVRSGIVSSPPPSARRDDNWPQRSAVVFTDVLICTLPRPVLAPQAVGMLQHLPGRALDNEVPLCFSLGQDLPDGDQELAGDCDNGRDTACPLASHPFFDWPPYGAPGAHVPAPQREQCAPTRNHPQAWRRPSEFADLIPTQTRTGKYASWRKGSDRSGLGSEKTLTLASFAFAFLP
jgi:hypothetical protein